MKGDDDVAAMPQFADVLNNDLPPMNVVAVVSRPLIGVYSIVH